MKKPGTARFINFVDEADALDSRISAIAELLRNLEEAPEPWVCSEIGKVINEFVARRKVGEVFFLGRDEKGLLGVPDSIMAGELKRLAVEHGDEE